MTKPNDQ